MHLSSLSKSKILSSQLVGLLELRHPRNQLQWQLARIMSLNLLNLYTLIFALFSKVDDMVGEDV